MYRLSSAKLNRHHPIFYTTSMNTWRQQLAMVVRVWWSVTIVHESHSQLWLRMPLTWALLDASLEMRRTIHLFRWGKKACQLWQKQVSLSVTVVASFCCCCFLSLHSIMCQRRWRVTDTYRRFTLFVWHYYGKRDVQTGVAWFVKITLLWRESLKNKVLCKCLLLVHFQLIFDMTDFLKKKKESKNTL